MRIWIAFLWLLALLSLARARDWEHEPLPLAPSAPSAAGVDEAVSKCRDFRNRTVHLVEIPALGDVGRAEFIQGSPVIMLDPALIATLPAKLQVFFKLHECAHHTLGHLFAPTYKSEKEADCWAVKEGRKRTGLTQDDIIAWKPYFAQSRGDPFGHMPGPQRVEFLLGCFDE